MALAPALLLLASSAQAAKVDVVELQNGTRVVGELKSMRKARLELSTDDMGTVQIEWGNVRSVTAPEFFEVEDMSGGLRFGSLRPGPAEGELEVLTPGGSSPLPLREVARIQLVKSGFWQRISGKVDLGVSYTSATSLLQLDGDAEVRFRRPRFEAFVTADTVITQQPEAEDTRRASLVLGYSRLFSNRQRLFTHATLEQNRELGYDLRASLVGGWARYLARNSNNELVGGAGLGVNQEVPVEGESTTNLEAVVGFNYTAFTYDFPNTDIELGAMTYLGLSQWGRVRVEANARLRRELFRDFHFGIKAYESYDSDPATEGAERNDWGVSLSLGYTF